MVQDEDEPVTPQELLAELSPSAPAFSATRVIGGKLRALYDDTTQPCPTVVDRLLRALDEGNPVTH
jgi:hypothetical protein